MKNYSKFLIQVITGSILFSPLMAYAGLPMGSLSALTTIFRVCLIVTIIEIFIFILYISRKTKGTRFAFILFSLLYMPIFSHVFLSLIGNIVNVRFHGVIPYIFAFVIFILMECCIITLIEAKKPNTRKNAIIGIIVILHYVISCIFTIGTQYFLPEILDNFIRKLILFPLFLFNFSSFMSFIIWTALNSLIWGIVIYLIFRRMGTNRVRLENGL
jgi:hypothetical protein